MRLTATITAFHNPEKLMECIQQEISKMNQADRSSVEIKKKGDCIEFQISAKDSTAMRACLNSVTKLLTVYEKVDRITEVEKID